MTQPGDLSDAASGSRPPDRGISCSTFGALLKMRPHTRPACLHSNEPARPPALPPAFKLACPPSRPPACKRVPARAPARPRARPASPLHLVLTFYAARRRLQLRRLISALDQPHHLGCAIPRAPASHCARESLQKRTRPPAPPRLHSNAPTRPWAPLPNAPARPPARPPAANVAPSRLPARLPPLAALVAW